MLQRFLKAVRLLQPSALRFGWWACPICGSALQVRLNTNEMGVRCVRCGASPVTQSIVDVIRGKCLDLSSLSVYELSSRGVLVDWLAPRAGSLTTSEYIPEVAPGSIRQGVRCEDVQRLTFADGAFDLCTSTEVFEHVDDDHAGFVQVRRVLRPGGMFIFTVPLSGAAHTIERARVLDGQLTHLLEPEYHDDPFSRSKQILCMRNYGTDIVERLRDAGFSRAELTRPAFDMMHYARTVIVAQR
ncbi:MAG: class I SAM-dependent methyltransferase [Metallibacterium sp.]